VGFEVTTPKAPQKLKGLVVMLVCMASYMTISYEHVNHIFRVNVCS